MRYAWAERGADVEPDGGLGNGGLGDAGLAALARALPRRTGWLSARLLEMVLHPS